MAASISALHVRRAARSRRPRTAPLRAPGLRAPPGRSTRAAPLPAGRRRPRSPHAVTIAAPTRSMWPIVAAGLGHDRHDHHRGHDQQRDVQTRRTSASRDRRPPDRRRPAPPRLRCCRWRSTCRSPTHDVPGSHSSDTTDNDAGMKNDVATPCTTRDTTSTSKVHAAAQNNVPTENSATPASSSRRRPYRSAMRPETSSGPAAPRAKAFSTQPTAPGDASRSLPMSGRRDRDPAEVDAEHHQRERDGDQDLQGPLVGSHQEILRAAPPHPVGLADSAGWTTTSADDCSRPRSPAPATSIGSARTRSSASPASTPRARRWCPRPARPRTLEATRQLLVELTPDGGRAVDRFDDARVGATGPRRQPPRRALPAGGRTRRAHLRSVRRGRHADDDAHRRPDRR